MNTSVVVRKTPSWIKVGAFILPFMAGMINSVALLGFVHAGVSYMTGAVAGGMLAAAEGRVGNAATFGLLVMSFFLGATIAGLIVGSERLKLGRRYGVALILESFILIWSNYLFEMGAVGGEYLAATACGLQNAIVATYSGAIIRSTHVTGIISDLGSLFGNWIARRKVDHDHVLLLSTILLGFVLGSWIGCHAWFNFGYRTLLIPASVVFTVGASYMVLRLRAIAVERAAARDLS